MNEIYGLRTKEKKEQKPAESHRIQGVQLSLRDKDIVIAPLDDRRKKLAGEIVNVLKEKTLLPQKAGKLAGKATFLNRTLLGRVGRAAVKALYQRQHAPCHVKGLSQELEAALWALLDIVLKEQCWMTY